MNKRECVLFNTYGSIQLERSRFNMCYQALFRKCMLSSLYVAKEITLPW